MSAKFIKLKPDQEYITLQAVLQIAGEISTGGMAKIYLIENEVKVNGELENRRGRKLFVNDYIEIQGEKIIIQ